MVARLALGLVAVSLAVAAVLLVGSIREEIAELVAEWGRWGPAAFVVLYVVLSLLFVPTSVLVVTGGIIFGALEGGALCMAGAVISAALGFAIGRNLGRDPVARLAGERFERADRCLRRHGILAVAIVRNVSALAYGMLNYAAGVTGIPAGRFLAGTALGIVPGTMVYATFGSSIDDLSSPRVHAGRRGASGTARR